MSTLVTFPQPAADASSGTSVVAYVTYSAPNVNNGVASPVGEPVTVVSPLVIPDAPPSPSVTAGDVTALKISGKIARFVSS